MSKNTKTAPVQKARYDVLVPDTYIFNGEERVNWIRVGVAFPHEDGEGFNIELKALPIGGKLVVQLHKAKEG